LNEALVKLEAVGGERTEWPGLSERMLGAAAQAMVDNWRRDGALQLDATSYLVAGGSDQIRRLVGRVATSLTGLRENLQGALRGAAAAVGSRQEDATEIPAPAGMPIMDLAASLPATRLRRPRLALASWGLACRITRARLSKRFGPRLTGLLEQHVRQLDQWRSQTLAQMRRSFAAKADFYRAQGGQTPGDSDLASIERDLKRLQSLPGG
jgi:hypothetical protein